MSSHFSLTLHILYYFSYHKHERKKQYYNPLQYKMPHPLLSVLSVHRTMGISDMTVAGV